MATQLTVRSSTSTSGEALNIFCSRTTPPAAMAAALEQFYIDLGTLLAGSATYELDPVYREFEPSTGQTTGLGNFAPEEVWQVDGGGSGSARLADQTALLIQWQTGEWVNGRQVTGRSYIPFPAMGGASGQPSGGDVTQMTTAAQNLAASDGAFFIWSRTGGSMHDVVAGVGRPEYAVQRSRRN